MPRIAATNFARRIQQLRTQRRGLATKLERIDATLRSIVDALGRPLAGPSTGAAADKAERGGRPARKGRRRKFATSGLESITAFVNDKEEATTAEINAHWAAEGRSGRADVALGKLVAAKKLKRATLKGVRGSRYTPA